MRNPDDQELSLYDDLLEGQQPIKDEDERKLVANLVPLSIYQVYFFSISTSQRSTATT